VKEVDNLGGMFRSDDYIKIPKVYEEAT